MKCVNCGAKLSKEVKFCTFCGHASLPKSKKNTYKKLILLCSILLVSILVGIIAYINSPTVKARNTVDLANKYFQEGKYDEAILNFEKVILIQPKNIEVRKKLAEAYLKTDKPDKAENQLSEAIKIDSKDPGVYLLLSEVYSKTGRISDQLSVLKKGTVETGAKELSDALNAFMAKVTIKDLEAEIIQGQQYTQPATVQGLYNNKDPLTLPVKWTTTAVDTSKAGETTVEGTIENYPSTVKLTLNISKPIGNTISNLTNDGIAVNNGDWIYYSNLAKNGYLYKIKNDGTDNTELNSQSSSNINIIGEWIYYISDGKEIYKIKTDGSQNTALRKVEDDREYYQENTSEARIYNTYVDNDKIYYIEDYLPSSAQGVHGNIFCIDINGKLLTKYNLKAPAFNIAVYNGWIYYWGSVLDGSTNKIKVDGTGDTDMFDGFSNRFSNKDIVFNGLYGEDKNQYITTFNTTNGIYQLWEFNEEGKSIKEITSFTHIIKVAYSDGWFYYWSLNDNSIYKMSKDGSGKTKLCAIRDVVPLNINVAGDWVYFEEGYDPLNSIPVDMCRVKKDGTYYQRVN